MESAVKPETRGQLDHEFLDAVEIEIRRALEQAAGLEASLEQLPIDQKSAWKDAFDHLNSSLRNWEQRLAELSRQTAAVETELQRQETAVRDWFAAAGAMNSRLTAIGRSGAGPTAGTDQRPVESAY